MGIQEETYCSSIYIRSWIYSSKCISMPSYLVKKDLGKFEWKTKGLDHNLLWKHLLNCTVQESSLPWETQTHWDQISLHQRAGRKWGYQDGILQVWAIASRHIYQAIRHWNFCAPKAESWCSWFGSAVILVCGSQDKGGVLEIFECIVDLMVFLEPHTNLPC